MILITIDFMGFITHRIHVCHINGNIYHQQKLKFVSINLPYDWILWAIWDSAIEDIEDG